MARWRRLARARNKLLACAVGGTTTNGETLWTKPRFLAIHPLYEKVVTPGGTGGRYVVFDQDTMDAVFNVPPIPTVTKTVVSRPYTGKYTISYQVSVVRSGTWFLNWNDYDRYNGDNKDLCGCGRLPGSYIDPLGASAFVELLIKEHQSEVVFNGNVPSWPEHDREWKIAIEVGANIDGETWVSGASSLRDLSGLSNDELASFCASEFPGHWEGGEQQEDVVTYEARDDEDFPVGVDYQRSE